MEARFMVVGPNNFGGVTAAVFGTLLDPLEGAAQEIVSAVARKNGFRYSEGESIKVVHVFTMPNPSDRPAWAQCAVKACADNGWDVAECHWDALQWEAGLGTVLVLVVWKTQPPSGFIRFARVLGRAYGRFMAGNMGNTA